MFLQNVNAASGRPDDKALLWIMQAKDPKVTNEQLKHSGRHGILDRRISATLQKIAHGELGRKITMAAETALAL